jgi:ADP-ribose pyrophosphatase YjhB (NUDIX family)
MTSVNGRIRAVAVCVFRHNDKVLVFEGFDSSKNETFYRSLGGGINFGETSTDAVAREIREELGAEITNIRQLGVLENIFEFEEVIGHQVIFIFDAEFVEASLYEKTVIQANEHADGSRTRRAI